MATYLEVHGKRLVANLSPSVSDFLGFIQDELAHAQGIKDVETSILFAPAEVEASSRPGKRLGNTAICMSHLICLLPKTRQVPQAEARG
jgi:hypothetical protein